MNYASLALLIQEYVENDEQSFLDNIPNFVMLAEERIYRYVKVPNSRTQTTIAATIGSADLTIPADFVSPDSLEVIVNGVSSNLIPKDFDFLTTAYPVGAFTGTPVFYAVFDNATLHIAPAPDQAYSMRLTYTQKPESIVTAGTNWIGDNAEQALLYASLIEAYTYLKGEQDMMAQYEERFMEAVGQTKQLSDGKMRTDEWRNAPPMAR